MKTIFFILSFLTAMAASLAQQPLTAAEKREAIDSIGRILADNYVFPEKGEALSKLLHQNLSSGRYDAISDPIQFADKLTVDVQELTADKHLRIGFDPEFVAQMRQSDRDQEGPPAEFLEDLRRDNYGFKEVKILDGNVGYLDLRGFMDASVAGETAAAAMDFLSGADAIIFDLRHNGGGSPTMIQLLTSYLYPAGEPVHLNNFYFRPENRTTQTWTLPHLPGRRNPDAEVFVLTSEGTFSAAEEFTYNLKNLERATIVGQTTGGGAHPGGPQPATERFFVWVPVGRAINPITNTNWEGTGVTPHVEVAVEKALDQAHLLALEKLRDKTQDEDLRKYYEWNLTILHARLHPVSVPAELLQSYAGQFGERALMVENGQLMYQRNGRPKYILTPLSETRFMFADTPSIHVEIEKTAGKVTAIQVLYEDGRVDRSPKS